jgi:hypothetical protein
MEPPEPGFAKLQDEPLLKLQGLQPLAHIRPRPQAQFLSIDPKRLRVHTPCSKPIRLTPAVVSDRAVHHFVSDRVGAAA